jgi:hypothetical protein
MGYRLGVQSFIFIYSLLSTSIYSYEVKYYIMVKLKVFGVLDQIFSIKNLSVDQGKTL